MKNVIKQNFSKASKSYDKYDSIQKASAENLVNKIIHNVPHDFYPDKILDLGCGTGNLTNELYKFFPNSYYYINDISEEMLSMSIENFQNKANLKIIKGDIEEIDIANYYDIIASNMCFQWVSNLEYLLNKLLKQTKILAFSCLIENSFKEWYDLLEAHQIYHVSRTYLSQNQIYNIVAKLGYNVSHSSQTNSRLVFTGAKSVAKYLQKIGANSPRSSLNNLGKLKSLFKLHKEICNIEYNIGFFIITNHKL